MHDCVVPKQNMSEPTRKPLRDVSGARNLTGSFNAMVASPVGAPVGAAVAAAAAPVAALDAFDQALMERPNFVRLDARFASPGSDVSSLASNPGTPADAMQSVRPLPQVPMTPPTASQVQEIVEQQSGNGGLYRYEVAGQVHLRVQITASARENGERGCYTHFAFYVRYEPQSFTVYRDIIRRIYEKLTFGPMFMCKVSYIEMGGVALPGMPLLSTVSMLSQPDKARVVLGHARSLVEIEWVATLIVATTQPHDMRNFLYPLVFNYGFTQDGKTEFNVVMLPVHQWLVLAVRREASAIEVLNTLTMLDAMNDDFLFYTKRRR